MSGEEPESILIENERDSLHILPLEILPLQTPGLKRARMIKNAGLDSVIELFQDASAGSGQLDVRDLPNEFDWDDGNNHPDMVILRKVANLPSYDVYSLRVALRQLARERLVALDQRVLLEALSYQKLPREGLVLHALAVLLRLRLLLPRDAAADLGTARRVALLPDRGGVRPALDQGPPVGRVLELLLSLKIFPGRRLEAALACSPEAAGALEAAHV